VSYPANFYTHHRDVAAFCEGTGSQAVCTPTGTVRFSYRLTDFEDGREFITALVKHAYQAWKEQ